MNTRQFVAGVSPEQDAIVQLTLAKGETAAAAAQKFFSSGAVEQGSTWGRSFYNFRTVPSQERPTVVRGLIGFLEHGEYVYQLVAYTPDEKFSDYQTTLQQSLASFNGITDQRYLDVKPKRISLVELPRRMTISQFNREYPSTVDDETLAIVNGVEPNVMIDAGTTVKRIVGGKLPGS
jgi:hypothetical protein